MIEISDKEILIQLENPKLYETGFRTLMQKYQEPLYWHIRRMVKSHDDANDVIQNTFIKVFKGIKNFKKDSKLYTWLYRIATNETITFINKKKKNTNESIDNEESNIQNKLVAETYSDENLALKKLKLAVEGLPEKQKLVFNMRYYDEMTYKQISEILETSVGGLKASYHHAVKKIELYIAAHAEQ